MRYRSLPGADPAVHPLFAETQRLPHAGRVDATCLRSPSNGSRLSRFASPWTIGRRRRCLRGARAPRSIRSWCASRPTAASSAGAKPTAAVGRQPSRRLTAPPPLFAGRPRTTIDTLMVRVATNRGVVGWGEAYGGGWQATVAALDHWVSPLALGQDATDAGLTPRLERALHNLGRAGPVIHAISGLDIALWDLRGKLEGVAVHALLGGRRRRRVEAYASLLSYGGSVEHVRRNVARALERGYRRIKLHERAAETVAATREVAGRDVPIMVDTNCAWLPDAATAAVMAMASSQPLWV